MDCIWVVIFTSLDYFLYYEGVYQLEAATRKEAVEKAKDKFLSKSKKQEGKIWDKFPSHILVEDVFGPFVKPETPQDKELS